VEISFKDGRPQRVTMTQIPAVFRPAKLNKKELASALGVARYGFRFGAGTGIRLYRRFELDGSIQESRCAGPHRR